jgi:arylsulfatase A-like enzyme
VPFAGLFASPVETAQIERWNAMLRDWDTRNIARVRADAAAKEKRWVETGIDAVAYRIAFNNWERSLYDEMMAHQDHQIGRLVERLVKSGEWEHTLLIVAADHSFSGGFSEFLVPLAEKQPPDWQWTPLLRSSETRVPLMFIWPGGIPGGQRFRQPVSMIDVLPTLLDLTGLPKPEVMQGQSLAPLLLGRPGWEPRPVIFDEFERDPGTGELRGRIEMIDGQWGASLWIGPPWDSRRRRPMPLLLFDVWNDPLALTLMNDAHPELVEKYTGLLQKQWAAHQALATQFTPGAKMPLAPEQLERLRALGYIR